MAQNFLIAGRVIDRSSRRGISGLRVEAWDKDTKYHDLLGVETTSSTGAFRIAFDDSYYGDFAPDRLPDVFFKIFQGQRLIKSTFDSPLMNVRGPKIEVTLEVDLPPAVTGGKDRVSTDQAFGITGFLRRSDFRGVMRESRDKTSAFGGVLGDAIAQGLSDWNYEPVRPSATQTSAIVGQNEALARENLSSNGVVVNQSLAYDPKANTDTLKLATSLPTNLKSGDKVNLYVKDGTVKYYSVVKAQQTDTASAQELEAVKQELAATRAESASKDAAIAGLQRDLAQVQQAQTKLTTQSDQRVADLERTVADLKTRLG